VSDKDATTEDTETNEGHGLLRAIRADDVDPSIVALARDADSPRAAADFAVLDEAALEIGFDVNLDFLAAIGARHEKTVLHRFR
jgi:hypothetical protein